MPNFSIDNLIADFSVDNLIAFFRSKISSFNVKSEDLSYMFDESKFEKYISIDKIGDATIDSDELIIICSKTLEPITETTGKKRQYDIAKKVLKQEVKDAAFFIFYDDEGNFRFSFVRANYLGNRRDFTDFKRYTYFVSPALTNNTFKRQIENCNFNTLDEIIEAFSVEPLNKQFYQEIAKAFYTLIGGTVKKNNRNIEYENLIQLPSTPINSNRRVYQEFGVRLIGRIIFCWFLKNKKSENGIPLVPESWLSSKAVVKVNEEHNEYYHNILEKLFFLVLNRNISERMDYLLPDGHELIPFLNGGLFDPHVNDFFISNQPNFALVIPNEWFLELFEVLEQFNFTIDENSIFDAEVSIDPEMLGTIFENLLAEIDPDTEKSARNATGSFYTPREIVDYMVEQSLIQYLKTKANITNDEALELLFKEGGENMFNKVDTENILQALSKVKILDPACGSGAFPMGAVSKIIKALKKLDHGAKWWREQQVRAVPNVIARRKLKEKLDASTSDYARKLGVIQNSIYGVDIQPVAAEISKLRCFLSLVIDENIDDNAVNRGIEPLPNLEFKFVTANTLIDLEDRNLLPKQFVFDFGETDELQIKLQQLRNDYLQAYGEDKHKLKNDFRNTQTEIFNQEIAGGDKSQNKRALQLASWNPFGNESNEWFNPQWMFGIEKFDIVIGNPPYGVSIKGDSRAKVLRFLPRVPDFEIYYFFIEVSKRLIKQDGFLSYIIPNTFLFNVYASNYRREMLDFWKMTIIDCTAFKIFEKASVYNAIILFQLNNENSTVRYFETANVFKFEELINTPLKVINNDDLLEFNQNWSLAFRLKEEVVSLINKIRSNTIPLIDLFPEISQGLIAYDKYRGQDQETIRNRVYHFNSFDKDNLKKWLWGSDITKYNVKWNGQEWIDYCDGLANPRDPKFFNGSRILIREITNPSIYAAYTDEELYHDPTIIVFLNSDEYSIFVALAILNSKLATFFHFNFSPKATKGAFPKIIIKDIKNFPLKPISESNKRLIENLVSSLNEMELKDEKILDVLNIIIYKLYNLNIDEVKLIDPEFPLTQTEYENYIIE